VIWLFDYSVWLVSADVNVTADVCDSDVVCVWLFSADVNVTAVVCDLVV
jgi:hypothetical protein